MRRHLIPFLFLLVLFNPCTILANHGLGGEVNWTCLGNGMYTFRLKFYRDCNGITPPNSVQLLTNHPIGSIILNLVQQNDISPNGFSSDGFTPCYDCVDGSATAPLPGLVEEYIYESSAVTLSGVPPPTGWWFRWGECCRSSNLSNINTTGGVGFAFRTYMFPNSGQNTNPCFDSSPYFTGTPLTIACMGTPVSYSAAALDPDADSLSYAWANPLDDNGATIPFAPGYSVSSPLPGPAQNPLNVGATLDPHTGLIRFTSYTAGYFVLNVKVTAYRGNKLAEVYRELQFVISNNCVPLLGGIPNSPPDVSPPFMNPVSGLFTEYIDTVIAGDTVSFQLAMTDFDLFSNGSVQSISVEADGMMFGLNQTDPSQGCPVPPCATLNTPTPFSSTIAANLAFNWSTTIDHLSDSSLINQGSWKRYVFNFRIRDNYCPANGAGDISATVFMVRPGPLPAPVLRCASVINATGDAALNWTTPEPYDKYGVFDSYRIFASLTPGGPFVLMDSVSGNFFNTSALITSSVQNQKLGTNAALQHVYWYVKTRSVGFLLSALSPSSDTLKTMQVTLAGSPSGSAAITWSVPITPLLPSHASKYIIEKQGPGGGWNPVDSSSVPSYTYVPSSSVCSDTAWFRIGLSDSTGCIMYSAPSSYIFNNPYAPAYITPPAATVCAGGTVLVQAPQAQSYNWSNGATSQSVGISTPGTYTVSVTYLPGCTATGSVVVSGATALSAVITGDSSVCSGVSTVFDAGSGYQSYLWSTGATSQTVSVAAPGIYTVTVSNGTGCIGVDSITLVALPLPQPVITGADSICNGTFTVLNAGIYPSYIWNTGHVTQNIQAAVSGTYTVTVTDLNGCTGTDSFTVTVLPLPSVSITAAGPTTFCQGDSVMLTTATTGSWYQWKSNGAGIPGANSTFFYAKTGGRFACEVTDQNGCSGISAIIQVRVPCQPPHENQDKQSFSSSNPELLIFPNPSAGEVSISTRGAGKIIHVNVSDLTGRIIRAQDGENAAQMQMFDLPSGVFIMMVETEKKGRLMSVISVR